MHVIQLCDFPLHEFADELGISVRGPVATPVQNLLIGIRTARPDVRVSVVTMSKAVSRDVSFEIAPNHDVHVLKAPRYSGMAVASLPRVRRVHGVIADLGPDVVHGQGTEREYGLCAVLSGRPNLLTVHGVLSEVHKVTRPPVHSAEHIGRLVERFVLARSANIVAISSYVDELLAARSSTARRFPIPNAVHPAFFEPVSRVPVEWPTFLSVGCIYPLKRTLEVVKAAAVLDRRGLRGRLVVAGLAVGRAQGAYMAAIREEARHCGRFQIEFPGWLGPAAIKELHAQAAGLVVASRIENSPMVVAEAMAAGVPVIATDVGGLRERVRHGMSGLLVPNADPTTLADAMQALIESPEMVAGMSITAKADAEAFRPEVVAAATVRAYEELAA